VRTASRLGRDPFDEIKIDRSVVSRPGAMERVAFLWRSDGGMSLDT